MSKEAEYFCKDFEWEQVKQEIESDPSLKYHSIPFSTPCCPVSFDPQPWKTFHIRHSTGKFFKERRYLLKEFPELVSGNKGFKVLEVGCGNGSTVLPILRAKEDTIIYACDCSTEALERTKEMIKSNSVVSVEQRFHPFSCDFAATMFPTWLACNTCRDASMLEKHIGLSEGTTHLKNSSSTESCNCCIGGVDFVSLIFTLSAVPRDMMPKAVRECFAVLKPGGLLLFRDYGLYDMTMLRFGPDKRVGFREYMRNDGTRSYFFSLDTVRDLFVSEGFIEMEVEYCCVKSVNRRNGKSMRRVWVHGKYQKPI